MNDELGMGEKRGSGRGRESNAATNICIHSYTKLRAGIEAEQREGETRLWAYAEIHLLPFNKRKPRVLSQ